MDRTTRRGQWWAATGVLLVVGAALLLWRGRSAPLPENAQVGEGIIYEQEVVGPDQKAPAVNPLPVPINPPVLPPTTSAPTPPPLLPAMPPPPQVPRPLPPPQFSPFAPGAAKDNPPPWFFGPPPGHGDAAVVPAVLPPQVGTGSGGVVPAIPTANQRTSGPNILPAAAQPPIDRPLESTPQPTTTRGPIMEAAPFLQTPVDPPIGFTGRSGVRPREDQNDNRFVPMEDRWRIGFPAWDRYGKGHPWVDDYPYVPGNWWDPYNQNVLKGDYPFFGQNTFFVFTGTSRSLVEPRQVPTATTPFESTARPFNEQFFGRPNQLSTLQFFIMSFDFFRGDGAFRPMDWRIKATPIFNINSIYVDEVAVVNPDVRRGRARERTYITFEEWFVEAKLADLSPNYDFLSARIGSQLFNSDFRGFIFSDINRGARLFGNRNSNREQFNAIYLNMLEKDTNSELNTFRPRHQQVLIGNYFIQDFIWPGYTFQASVHYNHDDPTVQFDKNDTLVRPDPVGVATPHGLDVVYLGWTGDGHINRYNINHALYYACGHDTRNQIANRGVDISAMMGALELSYDRDYVRFRTSIFYSSGDNNPQNGQATGFDAIFDNPQFAGGEFSYWQRQAIRLFGVNLVNRGSLIPNLRSSKIQGQSNFVNPGLFLTNFGVDIDITPRFRMINNVNLLWFDHTQVLEQYVYQATVDQFIGSDLSVGFEYRPFLNNNVIMKFGAATLLPGNGFYDLYNNLRSSVDPLFAAFVDLQLTY